MKRRRPGRPVSGNEAKKRYQVVLEPRVAEKLRKLGDNNLSRGIARAAEKAQGD